MLKVIDYTKEDILPLENKYDIIFDVQDNLTSKNALSTSQNVEFILTQHQIFLQLQKIYSGIYFHFLRRKNQNLF